MVVFRNDNDKDKFTEIYRLSIAHRFSEANRLNIVKGITSAISDSPDTLLYQCKLFCAESLVQIKTQTTQTENYFPAYTKGIKKVLFIKEFYDFFRYTNEYGGTTGIVGLKESKIIVDYLMDCGLFIIIEKNDAVVLLNKGFIFEGLLQ